MENLLLSLESTAGHPDPEVINSIFRSAHSIKGVTGFCGLNRIKETAHVFESVLNAYRSGTIKPNPDAVDTLLKATDFLKTLLNDAVNSENYDIERIVSGLNRILNGGDEIVEQDTTAVLSGNSESPNGPATLVDGTGRYFFHTATKQLADISRKGHQVYIVRLDFLKDLPDGASSRDTVMDHIASLGEIIETCCESEDGVSPVPAAVLMSSLIEPPMMASALNVPEEEIELISDIEAGMGMNAPAPAVTQAAPTAAVYEPVAPAVETPRTEAKEAPSAEPALPDIAKDIAKLAGGHAQSSLRVNVALLDKLMNLAGELVLGRNQLLQTSGSLNISSLTPVAQRIDMITSEIQAEIMQTRMQELSFVFGKFPRLVRDLSRALNKKVDLQIEGEDTELDKTIIESLNDPLVHLIRNSLDHGIETPEVRIAAGKNPVGKLEVMAYHEAG